MILQMIFQFRYTIIRKITDELTKLVHGEEEAKKAKEASHALFAGGGVSAHMPTVEVTADDLYNDKLDIMARCV